MFGPPGWPVPTSTIMEQCNVEVDTATKQHWDIHQLNQCHTAISFHGKPGGYSLKQENWHRPQIQLTWSHLGAGSPWILKEKNLSSKISILTSLIGHPLEKLPNPKPSTPGTGHSSSSLGFAPLARWCTRPNTRRQPVHSVGIAPKPQHIFSNVNTPISQLIWDTAIQLWEYLLDMDTEPGLWEDLNARIDSWWQQCTPPPMSTAAGHAQSVVIWENLAHGFLSTS